MPHPLAPAIVLNSGERKVLEKIIRRSKSLQSHVIRARIILLAAEGLGNQQISDQLSIALLTVRTWRKRWLENTDILKVIEDEKNLYYKVLEILSDQPRSGAPPTYSAEVVCQIIAVSCEPPEACGYPISHWTPSDLRLEVIKRGIVQDISVRQIGRFLKRR
jgi:putative transposase